MVKKWRRYEGIKEEISIKIIKRKQKEENGKKIIINYKKVYKQAAKIVKGWQKYIFQREKKEEKKKLIQKRKKNSQPICLPLITGFWKKKGTKNTPKPTFLDLSPVEFRPKTPLTKINLLSSIP